MTRFSVRKPPVSADDLRLWRHAMRDVEPLPGSEAPGEALLTETLAELLDDPVRDSRFAESLRHGTGIASETVGSPDAATSVPVPVPTGTARRAQRGGDAAVRPESLPRLEIGRSTGVDRRTDERLRRGRLGIEGRIDLHGLTRADAHTALIAFLRRAQRDGKRCVLVITGKGAGRGEEADGAARGVLRRTVPLWLDQAPLRPMVLAVHRAQPRDGGDGALYVLLKKAGS